MHRFYRTSAGKLDAVRKCHLANPRMQFQLEMIADDRNTSPYNVIRNSVVMKLPIIILIVRHIVSILDLSRNDPKWRVIDDHKYFDLWAFHTSGGFVPQSFGVMEIWNFFFFLYKCVSSVWYQSRCQNF